MKKLLFVLLVALLLVMPFVSAQDATSILIYETDEGALMALNLDTVGDELLITIRDDHDGVLDTLQIEDHVYVLTEDRSVYQEDYTLYLDRVGFDMTVEEVMSIDMGRFIYPTDWLADDTNLTGVIAAPNKILLSYNRLKEGEVAHILTLWEWDEDNPEGRNIFYYITGMDHCSDPDVAGENAVLWCSTKDGDEYPIIISLTEHWWTSIGIPEVPIWCSDNVLCWSVDGMSINSFNISTGRAHNQAMQSGLIAQTRIPSSDGIIVMVDPDVFVYRSDNQGPSNRIYMIDLPEVNPQDMFATASGIFYLAEGDIDFVSYTGDGESRLVVGLASRIYGVFLSS